MPQIYEKLLYVPNIMPIILLSLKQHYVFYVWCVGEHIHWLHCCHAIVFVHIVQVASLCGWVATNVYDTLWSCLKDGLNHIGMHSGTWWVGDDDIGLTVLCDKLVSKDILHIASIEQGVVDAVNLRVDLSVLDSLGHILDTYHPASLASGLP